MISPRHATLPMQEIHSVFSHKKPSKEEVDDFLVSLTYIALGTLLVGAVAILRAYRFHAKMSGNALVCYKVSSMLMIGSAPVLLVAPEKMWVPILMIVVSVSGLGCSALAVLREMKRADAHYHFHKLRSSQKIKFINIRHYLDIALPLVYLAFSVIYLAEIIHYNKLDFKVKLIVRTILLVIAGYRLVVSLVMDEKDFHRKNDDNYVRLEVVHDEPCSPTRVVLRDASQQSVQNSHGVTPLRSSTSHSSRVSASCSPYTRIEMQNPHAVAPLSRSPGGSASRSRYSEECDLIAEKAEDIASELRGTSIYLVGIKSKIKTSLGKFIAETLHYNFFDSDKLTEGAAGGAAAAKSFRERDEKGFRESEAEILKQLSSMGRLVVSAGNGAFESPMNLSLPRHGILIWIDIPLDMIAREAVEDGLQLSEVELSPSVSYRKELDQLTALYKQMQGGYATADATVSLQKLAQRLGYDALDAVTVEDMGLEVLKEMERLMRVKDLVEEAARPF